MNNLLTFTVRDLLLFVLWILVVLVLIYFIKILSRTLKLLGNISGIFKDNQDNINRTMCSVPEIAKHAESISSEISNDVAAFRETIENVAHTSSKATAKLKEDSSLFSGVGSIVHTVSIGKALYDKYFGNSVVEDIKDVIKDVDDAINKKEDTENLNKRKKKSKKGRKYYTLNLEPDPDVKVKTEVKTKVKDEKDSLGEGVNDEKGKIKNK